MITVDYEEYYNDYRKSFKRISLNSLDDIVDWIFKQMKWNHPLTRREISVPNPDKTITPSCDYPYSIEFNPEYIAPSYWIHMISCGSTIIFSDGKNDAGTKALE